MNANTIQRAIITTVATACSLLSISCARAAPQSSRERLLARSELTPAEIQYGRGVRRDASVTYQRDVVIVENGPEAIRSAGADGFTWVIDPGAARALSVGKIAFVTGRCVGRVLAMQRDGTNMRLTLGPVELTEIFKKLEITVKQTVDPTQGIAYDPPQFPGMSLPLSGDDAATSDWASIRPAAEGPRLQSLAYRMPARQQRPGTAGILPPVFKLNLQTTTPLNDADGWGMEFRGEKYGLRAVVQAQVRLQKPWLEFHLSINSGHVDARLILHNAAGLKLAFDSAVDSGGPRNVNWYSPAGSFSFPISGSVPLAFDVRQELYMDIQFLSGTSSFSAGGNYDFNGDLGLTYQNAKFDFVGPKGLTERKRVMDNVTGVAIAPRRFAFRHAVIVTAGVGGAGFTAGPQLIVGTRLEVKQGGNTGIIQCQGAALTMGVKGGVGWTIPRLLAKFVNLFLNLIQVQEIADHGGIHTNWKFLFTQKTETAGQICGGG